MSTRAISAVLAVAWLAAGTVGSFGGNVFDDPPAPADLYLNPDEIRHTEALSNFAWGLFLQYSGDEVGGEAEAYYRAALEREPDSAVVLEHLVSPFLVRRDHAGVVRVLESVAAENPGAADLQIAFAESLVETQQTERAIAVLRKALEANRWQDARLLRQLFVALWQAERPEEVEALLRKARRKSAFRGNFTVEHASAFFHHSLARFRSEQDKGESHLRRLMERARTHALRAAELARPEQAERDVRTLGALLDDLEEYDALLDMLGRVRVDGHHDTTELDLLTVKALFRTGRRDEGLAYIRTLGDTDPVHPYGFSEIGRIYEEVELNEEAADAYERFLRSYPTALAVRFRLAYLYLTLDRPAAGLATLSTVNGMPPAGLLLKAHLHRAAGEPAAALDALEAAARTATEAGEAEEFLTVDYYLFHATICEEEGRFDRCIELAEKALALSPDDASCLNFLGYVLADQNRELERAEALVRKALDLAPDTVAYLDSLAWVYYRQGRYADAFREITAAMTLSAADPDPVILDHAGDICAANGLPVLARTYWAQALAADPDDPETIRRKIDALPPPIRR